jgi:hypothetical protein
LNTPSTLSVRTPASVWWPAVAWLSLALPTLWGLMAGAGVAYSRGHEPLLLGVAVWLLWRQGPALQALPHSLPGPVQMALMAFTLLLYLLGHTQEFIRIEMLALWCISVQLLWWFKGWPAVRQTWFVWLFALFVLPLPFSWVLALTSPLKEGVSALAAMVLQAVGWAQLARAQRVAGQPGGAGGLPGERLAGHGAGADHVPLW